MADFNKNQVKFVKQDRLAWDDFFMQVAETTAARTACIFHKIGSVFVDDKHKIISIGYNGPSRGEVHCNEVGCAKIHGDPVTGEIRRCRGVHSEINAIINSGDSARLENSTLYITIFPCYDCMKVLANIGVQKIVYKSEYLRVLEGTDGSKKVTEPEARELADRKGIILFQYQSPDENKKINQSGKNHPRW